MVSAAPDVQGEPHHFALFDFEPTDSGLVLVVAMQPGQAFQVVRHGSDETFSLEAIGERGDLLAAFVTGRVTLVQGDMSCEWIAEPDPVPPTLLEAHAEGITVRGPVQCPDEKVNFELRTDLFVEGNPDHSNIVRYQAGEGFHILGSLNAETQEMIINPMAFDADQALSKSSLSLTIGIVLFNLAMAGFIIFLISRKTKHASTWK